MHNTAPHPGLKTIFLHHTFLATVISILILGIFIPHCDAQYSSDQPAMGTMQQGLPLYLQQAGIAQNLNHKLPLAAQFIDSTGKAISLGQYFGSRPVVMAEVYFSCGMLCPQVMRGAAESLRQTGLKAGKDYEVVIASFDPADTPQEAAEAKQRFLKWLGDPSAAAGVHFLTGTTHSIDALTDATGFHYVRMPDAAGKMNQFAHSSVVMVATPDGRLSKYFSGIEYAPRDLRLAVVEASNHQIGTMSDLFLIYCCNYNPASGRYSVAILRVLGLAGVVTILILLGLLFLLTRKPKGRQFPPSTPTAV